MKAVLTRVSSASVRVDGETVGAIDCSETGGVLALVGVGANDDESSWRTMARKIAELRILEGELSVTEAEAPVLLVRSVHADGRNREGKTPLLVARRAPGHRRARTGDACRRTPRTGCNGKRGPIRRAHAGDQCKRRAVYGHR